MAISIVAAGATGSAPEEDPFAMEAESYAADFRTTLEEATRRLKLQTTIGELDRHLTNNESQTFAGLWIQHEPNFAVLARFTGDGENTIRPYVRGGELEDLVQVGTATNTLAALEEAQAAATEMIRSVPTRINSRINVPENRVEILTLDKTDLESRLGVAEFILPNGVEVIEISRLAKPATDIYGGLAPTTCTLGFSVEDTSGTKGVTTAAHCNNLQSYDGNALAFEYESWTIDGDTVVFDDGRCKLYWWSDTWWTNEGGGPCNQTYNSGQSHVTVNKTSHTYDNESFPCPVPGGWGYGAETEYTNNKVTGTLVGSSGTSSTTASGDCAYLLHFSEILE